MIEDSLQNPANDGMMVRLSDDKLEAMITNALAQPQQKPWIWQRLFTWAQSLFTTISMPRWGMPVGAIAACFVLFFILTPAKAPEPVESFDDDPLMSEIMVYELLEELV